ncbi:exopolysaccharide biosynthesis polyprenyl glycosylphosphotransferase [Floccifex sp.]|uniref:exopolysaccharide biosynthesis polyprenyl glycosylphosphotransferase n=1 Tax=Floccifex sp. TaxID=2815810 RepID=UPI003F06D435
MELISEIFITLFLLWFFQFNVYIRKYLFAYVVVQYMMGRYKKNSVLIWDEINLLIKSHILYLLFCFVIAPHNMYTVSYLVRLVLMTVVSFVLVVVCSRTIRIVFRDRLKEKILVFGIGENAKEIDRVVRGNRFSLMEVMAFVNCNESERIAHKQVPLIDESKMIDLKDVKKYLENNPIDSCIFSIQGLSKKEMDYLMSLIDDKVMNIKYVPRIEGIFTFNSKPQNFDGLVLINTSTGDTQLMDVFFKRCMDICAGLVGCLFLIPLTVIVKILNLLCHDTGPVFFKQDRIGLDGKAFKMYKYRSMVVGAEKKLEELMEKDPMIREEYLTNKKLENDPRVTKAGNFLRKSSLDEFPQFINVLKGDMSLIGPRPYLFREIPDMKEYYKTVIKSKPGITGMWQTHGRSEVCFEDRLELDEYYYRNWNLDLDIQLLIRTVKTVFMKMGAK